MLSCLQPSLKISLKVESLDPLRLDRWRLKSALSRFWPAPLLSTFVLSLIVLLSRKDTIKSQLHTQWTEYRMEPLNIHQLASKCAASFKARFEERFLDSQEEECEERDVLETQNARFNLWADNIGE